MEDKYFEIRHKFQCLRTLDHSTISSFQTDAGHAASTSFQNTAGQVLEFLSKACDVAGAMVGFSATSLEAVGSTKLNAAIPSLSDIDTIVTLSLKDYHSPKTALNERSLVRSFFDALTSVIRVNSSAKVRLRSADSGNMDLLTLKIKPKLPAVDILVALVNTAGEPTSATSASILLNKWHTNAIMSTIQTFAANASTSSVLPSTQNKDSTLQNAILVNSGALRYIKAWARNKDIYGQGVGFLPGAGYATMLAAILSDGLASKEIQIGPENYSNHDIVSKSVEVTHFFFHKAASRCLETISLPSPKIGKGQAGTQNSAEMNALKRGTMAIIARYRFSL